MQTKRVRSVIIVAALFVVGATAAHSMRDAPQPKRARVRTDVAATMANCLTNPTNLTADSAAALSGCPDTHLPSCATAAPGEACYGGPYMTAMNNDPWNNPYRIEVEDTTGAVIVTSSGPDGVRDTADDVTYVE